MELRLQICFWSWLLLPFALAGCPADSTEDATTGGCPATPCLGGQTCVAGSCTDAVDVCVDEDGDGYGRDCPAGPDCDDSTRAANPGNEEFCGDELDNDCNDAVDDPEICSPCVPECEVGDDQCSGDRISRCDDSSGCGLRAPPEACPDSLACRAGDCVEICLDLDRDGFSGDCEGLDDCDDARRDVYPGAPEVCDGVDNDCDPHTLETVACAVPCEDACTLGDLLCTGDASGYLSCQRAPDGCTYLTGAIPCREGSWCDSGTCGSRPVCIDPDGDGYGPVCTLGADCRALDSSSFLGAAEVCDGIDNDCDALVDEGGVCTACTQSPPNAPISIGIGEPLYRVACGGMEYFDLGALPSGSRLSVVVAAESGPLPLSIGSVTDSTFSERQAGFALGDATALLYTTTNSDTSTLRVQTEAGTRFAIVANVEGASCEGDQLEPNDAPGSAAAIGTAPLVFAGTLCAGGLDFFAVDVLPGDVIATSLVFEGETGRGLRTSVWRNGIEVTPSFAGPPSDAGFAQGRYTFFRTDLPGEYAIGVRGLTSDSQNDYALAITALGARATGACQDDPQEVVAGLDDDSLATARSLSEGQVYSQVLCAGDFDVIRLGQVDSGRVTGALTFDNASGNIDGLLLLDRLSGVVQTASADVDDEFFDVAASSAGQYFMFVHGRSARDANTYTLRYDIE